MRFCLLTASLALIQVAFVIGDEDLFSDELYEPFEEWAAEPSLGSGLGISLEPLLWNLDDAQLTQDSNFNLASRPMNDEPNTDNTDFWASCSPGGLGARAEPQSCPVPLRKDEAPTLPTLRDLEKAVGNTPNFHPETEPLRENTIVPLYRADSKCPPTHPHHLCCICDDAFAFEVCQDCFLYGGLCVPPHIQVCCFIYGRQPNPGSGSFLDDWLDEGYYNPGLNTLGGVFAEQCIEL